MLSYKNEAAFSKALCSAMRAKGIFVQRIESGETGKGIPDLFVITKGVPVWIELKRVHKTIGREPYLEIPWRPGQQAWLNDVQKRGVMVMTLACYDNYIVRIDHHGIWTKNLVPVGKVTAWYKSIKELLG